MSDDAQQPIIIKRIKKVSGGAHGGAWKIAYADFVTAMMAFFLLMWLLGSTSKGDLDGIAQFFQNPLRVARDGGTGSGDAERIVPGGGEDLSRRIGQVKKGDIPSRSTFQRDGGEGSLPTKGRSDSQQETPDQQRVVGAAAQPHHQQNSKRAQENAPKGAMSAEEVERERERRKELVQMERVRSIIEAMIEADEALRALRDQIRMQVTEEGLVIEIVDEKNRPMFALGSSQVQPYMRDLLRLIGRTLQGIENKIMIAGHTDATPFAGGGRGTSNWELSADRANAARRELVAGGLAMEKVFRVVGMADTIPFVPEDPLAPQNRRISIIVLKREAEEDLRREAAELTAVIRRGLGQP